MAPKGFPTQVPSQPMPKQPQPVAPVNIRHVPAPPPAFLGGQPHTGFKEGAKPPFVLRGMFGIGDNLHTLAVVRELMKTYDLWLETCHAEMFHEEVAKGLKLVFRKTTLRAQARTVAREHGMFNYPYPPPTAPRRHLGYNKPEIDKWGAIVHALYGMAGLDPVKEPDFHLTVKPEWLESAKRVMANYDTKGKPLLIYRPIVLRKEWDGAARNPDPVAYTALFSTIREKFFVFSLADLAPGKEWIVGPEQEADAKHHAGDLDFPTIAGLFQLASMVYSPAGFAPVLAQAVGTPSITIYGGRESFRTTQAAGVHLAPTLGIDTDKPCDCHSLAPRCGNRCQKHITLEPAAKRIRDFVDLHAPWPSVTLDFAALPATAPVVVGKPKVLIYATIFVDCEDRLKLTKHWLTLHQARNPDCDFLLVDSQSPMQAQVKALANFDAGPEGERPKLSFYTFPDNIGHLSRRGKDGWGRAFCWGLDVGLARGYDYVVHIEGDSLFRLPVMPICEQMRAEDIKVASIPVIGMKNGRETDWVETGLMFFSTKYLKESKFVSAYNWPRTLGRPTPEVIIFNLLHNNLTMMSWKGMRGDKNQITNENVVGLDLDWVTHCHKDSWVYDRYMEHEMGHSTGPDGLTPSTNLDQPVHQPIWDPPDEAAPLLKLNLGCGTNKIQGWQNHDADVDINKPLPFGDNTCRAVFCEHCVEHTDYYSAIRFFQECLRVLAPGGVVRITVPSIEQIQNCNDQDYYRFTTKWQKVGPTARGAMAAILFSHGHKTAWTASLLNATLYYAGFEKLVKQAPGESDYTVFKKVEGHGKVITDKFNNIESLCIEGMKP